VSLLSLEYIEVSQQQKNVNIFNGCECADRFLKNCPKANIKSNVYIDCCLSHTVAKPSQILAL